jgi:hypothetical protein
MGKLRETLAAVRFWFASAFSAPCPVLVKQTVTQATALLFASARWPRYNLYGIQGTLLFGGTSCSMVANAAFGAVF